MISVIIPVYNKAPYLAACLDSLRGQTFTEWEAWLVDDGSTDDSRDICGRYVAQDVRFHLLTQDNAGPSAARNAALTLVTGDEIAFIDGDDLLHPAFLALLHQALASTGADMVQARYQIHKASSRERLSRRLPSLQAPSSWTTTIFSGEDALLAMLYQQPAFDSSLWDKLYRREAVVNHRFPSCFKVYEDLYFLATVLPTVHKVASLSLPLYFYFKEQGGTLCQKSCENSEVFAPIETLEAQYLVQGQNTLLRAARERRFSLSCHVLRLLSSLPHTPAHIVLANRCHSHIRALRYESLHDKKARLKNRLFALLSYLILRP